MNELFVEIPTQSTNIRVLDEAHSPSEIQKSPLKFTQLSPLSLHDSQPLSSFESQSSFPVQTDYRSAISQLQTQPQQKFKKKFTSNLKQKLKTQRPVTNIESTVSRLENIAAIASASKVESPFDVFGKSVAAQLKLLPRRHAIAAQLKIQTILTEELLLYEDNISQSKQLFSSSQVDKSTSIQEPTFYQSTDQPFTPVSTPSLEPPSSVQSIYTDTFVDSDNTISDDFNVLY